MNQQIIDNCFTRNTALILNFWISSLWSVYSIFTLFWTEKTTASWHKFLQKNVNNGRMI